jgi:hypothetical protein
MNNQDSHCRCGTDGEQVRERRLSAVREDLYDKFSESLCAASTMVR